MSSNDDLFGPAPPRPPKKGKKERREELEAPLWTEQKSLLITEYLHGFLHVTKSGAYIDLFAGPQSESYCEDWSIKRVIERRDAGPNFRYFAACDDDAEQIGRLKRLREAHAERSFTFNIYQGDANVKVGQILSDLPARLPCFCLIDQRTLECDWRTVERVAAHRSQPFKIEIFYFLAASWLDRSWRSRKNPEDLRTWWGASDFVEFLQLPHLERALFLAKRFKTELGYRYAHPWSIHERGIDGRTMYYMVHASDHYRAPGLMSAAYNAVKWIGFNGMSQAEMFSRLPTGQASE